MPELLQKHTLNLYAGDMEKLKELYPDTGASVIIRDIVRSFINQCEGADKQLPDIKIEVGI